MKSKLLTVTYASGFTNNEIPSIRLQGKWLESIGFKTGNKIIVEMYEGKLIIKDFNTEESRLVEEDLQWQFERLSKTDK